MPAGAAEEVVIRVNAQDGTQYTPMGQALKSIVEVQCTSYAIWDMPSYAVADWLWKKGSDSHGTEWLILVAYIEMTLF